MLSKEIRGKVAQLRQDNRSGAADITLSAIRVVQKYLRATAVRDKGEFLQDLRELCGGLLFAQSAMFSVRNACLHILSALSEYRDGNNVDHVRHELEKKLAKLAQHISLAPQRIAGHLSKVLPCDGRILTISYSSTVMGVLKSLKRRGRKFEVAVMESRPMLEGRRTAQELARAKIRTTIIADVALGEYVKMADLVVVGADAVYSDGSIVNKVGTFPLAVCCRELRKPLYVLADSTKITTGQAKSFVIEEKTPRELLRNPIPGLAARNFYFELTPAKFIKAIISEKGIFSPHVMRKNFV